MPSVTTERAVVPMAGCCSEPTEKAGDRNVPVSHSCSQGSKPQQSYVGLTLLAGGEARSSAWRAGHCSHSGLDSPGNLEHFISLCSMFFHLLSTSHLGKGTDKQCLRSFDEAGKKIMERISSTSLYHCNFLFIQLPASTDNRPQTTQASLFRAGSPRVPHQERSSHNSWSQPEKFTGCCGTALDLHCPK